MQFPVKVKPITGDYAGQVILVTSEDELAQVGPFDFVKITPQEMQAEIETEKKKALLEDNPFLSRLFPASMQADVNSSGAWSIGKAAVKNGANLIGRAIGAASDAIFNTPYGTSAKDVFVDSFGTNYDETPSLISGRSFIGDLLQGAIRDPFAVPSLAVPVSKLPYIATISSPLLKSVAGGLAISSVAEGSRPLLIDDGFNTENALKNIMLGTTIPAVLYGAKVGTRGVERTVRGDYGAALTRLADMNNVPSDALDLLSTPDGRAGLAANFRQEPQIADEMLGLRQFNDETFPEHADVKAFLARSQENVIPQDVADLMQGYGNRIIAGSQGGGLNIAEKASVNRLGQNAEMLLDQAQSEPTRKSVALSPDDYGLIDFKPEAIAADVQRKARPMNARTVNDVRQRIGSLLDDEWNRIEPTMPKGEANTLKQAYHGMRQHLMSIAEKEGETAAIAAYKSIAAKMGAREELFKWAKIGNNKISEKANAERAITNSFNSGNANHRELQDAMKTADNLFGTNIYGRARYASASKNLASSKHPANRPFAPSEGNKFVTGKGWSDWKNVFMDQMHGRTVKSAGEKLTRMRELQLPTESMRNGYGWLGYGVPAPESVRMGILGKTAQDDRERDQYGFMQGR